jgi:hypothetical protein
MFKQNAFATAAPSNNGERLTLRDLKIDTSKDFLPANFLPQCPHCDHWR